MPETTLEPQQQTPPPPAQPNQPPAPNLFETPKIEPKPLESSNFMADLTKAFQKSVDDGSAPAPDPKLLAPPETKLSTPPPTPEPKKEAAPEPPETFTPKAKDRWRAREQEY